MRSVAPELMAFDGSKLTDSMRQRWRAARGWMQPRAHHAWALARKAAGRAVAWPWKRIGLWAGGAAGVLVTALVLFLTFADWNALREPISRWASHASGRQIAIRGDLEVFPWSLTPRIHVQRLHIGNPQRFRERGAFAEIADANLNIRLLPLLVGRFEIVRLELNGADVALYRNASGDANWSSAPNARSKPLKLPPIEYFSLRNGRLRLADEKRNLTLDATFNTQESATPRRNEQFSLSGEGEINRQRFALELTGAPLLNVRRDRPYPFVAEVRAGATHIEADGAIQRPFNFSLWQAHVSATGRDLADLYYLIGLTLPNTPPYSLRGVLNHNGSAYGMENLAGRIGDSDVRGRFTASTQTDDRLMFEGDFVSNQLDLDDLLAVLGAPPGVARDETASPEQRALAADLRAQGRVLPDAPLDISRVRNMDAQVTYRAARVRSERLPLRGVALDIDLDHGLLRLDPLTLDLRQGRLGGAVAINARQDTPRVDVDVRLSNARLESVLALRGDPPMTGALLGRARLSGAGASVREAAANASGDITLVTPSGEVREAFAELTGINVTRGLGLLLTGDRSKIDVRCGVASFHVENGVANARSFVFDTETMLIRGSGQLNLRNETLDLRIEGEPKEARLIRVAAPISVEGHWRSPRLGVEVEEAAGQTGLAALLASVVAPIAAVLPFVDSGLAEDANCQALLAGRQSETREG